MQPLYRESALVRLPRKAALSPAAEAFADCLREQAIALGLEVLPVMGWGVGENGKTAHNGSDIKVDSR
jgi:hypothetical protein